MSLNGLDTPAVYEAYNNSTVENAGWFLLKYVSRDTVELLSTGNAGVSEARTAIAQYDEKSPLYGLIMFRRKKVLIKYIPEGTSRLLQARTTVHFQHILEKYAPYETLLEITSAEALSDTALASAFPLRAGTSSVSNVKLDEITEDAEEGASPARPRLPGHAHSVSSTTSRRAALERSAAYKRSVPITYQRPPEVRVTSHEDVISTHTAPLSPQTSNQATDAASLAGAPSPEEAVRAKSPSERDAVSPASETTDFTKSLDRARQSPPQTYLDYESFDFRPKVKLGPRPVTLSERKKSSLTVNANGRPTSNLPSGMHIKSKHHEAATKLAAEPKSAHDGPRSPRDSPMVADVRVMPSFPKPPPVPDTASEYMPTRPNSRGSSRSTPSRTKGAMTPEKQRLLKAVEMRKKQMRKSTPKGETGSKASADNAPEPPRIAEYPQAQKRRSARNSASDQSAKKSDSGVDMGYDQDKQAAADQGDNKAAHGHGANVEQVTENGAEEVQARSETPTSQHTQSLEGAGTQAARPPTPKNTDEEPRSPSDETLTSKIVNHPSPAIAVHETSQPAAKEERVNPKIDNEPSSIRFGADDSSSEAEDFGTSKRSVDIQRRRQGLVLPLIVGAEHDHSETEPEEGYDDDFMDELGSATVHEAKPMAFSRSPATPVLSKRPSLTSSASFRSDNTFTLRTSPTSPGFPLQRTPSHPYGYEPPSGDFLDPKQAVHSSEGTPTQDHDELLVSSRKGSVSLGISKRIEQLAQSRSRESSPQPKEKSRSPPTQKLSGSPRQGGRELYKTRSGSESGSRRESSPETTRDRLRSYASPPAARTLHSATPPRANGPNSTQTIYKVQQDRNTQRDSVSVTARIVRSDQSGSNAAKNPSELHHSPLTINHQRAAPQHATVPPLGPILAATNANWSQDEASTIASSKQRDGSVSPAFSRQSVESKRKSFSRYRRSSVRMDSVSESRPEPAPVEEPAKSTRTSRFLKRMSGFANGRKRSVQAPADAKSAEYAGLKERDVPPGVIVGDINVQFPDTSLWKRRWAEIDASGHLVFTVSNSGAVKRFHLGEFSRICIPAMDELELPNSVVLQLGNGSGSSLQCACEDAMAQRHLLHLFQSYHQAWLDV